VRPQVADQGEAGLMYDHTHYKEETVSAIDPADALIQLTTGGDGRHGVSIIFEVDHPGKHAIHCRDEQAIDGMIRTLEDLRARAFGPEAMFPDA